MAAVGALTIVDVALIAPIAFTLGVIVGFLASKWH